MDIQHPVCSLDHFAGPHELAHCQSLVVVIFNISQEYHGKAFARASAGDTDIGVGPVMVLRILVYIETLDYLISTFELGV